MPSSSRVTRWSIPLAAAGVLLIFMSLCVGCLSLSIAFDPPVSSDPGGSGMVSWLLVFAFFAVPMMLAGAGALWASWRRYRSEKRESLLHIVLELAQRHDGVVTASDLALRSTLPLDRAQDLLEDLAARGICRLEANEDETTCFVFPRPNSDPQRTISTYERPV